MAEDIVFTLDATQADASDLQSRIDSQTRPGDTSKDAYIYYENGKLDAFLAQHDGDKFIVRDEGGRNVNQWFSTGLRARCTLYANAAARQYNGIIGRPPLSEYVFATPFELTDSEIQFITANCDDGDTLRLLNNPSRRVVCISHVRRPCEAGPADLNFHVKFNIKIVVEKRTSETIDNWFEMRRRG
eukprot:gb/GFBE01007798.1/.p1 GENE.gb/GFBE01007798.1/~~gb/GFBE01007798.1/.p1  ORF type:complete len:186 (+),score=22.87 gb/GFBE01007798.1/:1-558(+)